MNIEIIQDLNLNLLVNLAYIFASIMCIFGLKMLGSPETARRGNLTSASGMLLAVIITLLDQNIISFQYVAIGILIVSLIGYFAATLVKMTSMPEMVALFNGFGGIASLLVGSSEFISESDMSSFLSFAIYLTILIGGVTFTGSLIAYGKLSETISGKPYIYKGQQIVNTLLLLTLLIVGIEMIALGLSNLSNVELLI